MKNSIKSILDAWNESRELTWDLVNSILDDHLLKVQNRPGLNTVGMHLIEMADVTMGFAKSLQTGKLSLSSIKEVYSVDEQSKDFIKNSLEQSDKLVEKATSEVAPDFLINAFGEECTVEDILLTLLRHENLHHGQIIAFAFASHIPIPKSWTNSWALPSQDD